MANHTIKTTRATRRMPEQAEKQKIQADIVFCLDITGSMQPCINGVKNHIRSFVRELNRRGSIDYRLRLIGYRDLHDSSVCPGCSVLNYPHKVSEEPWYRSEFTSDVDEFVKWLDMPVFRAGGGGDMPESTLDALYEAIRSDWRSHRAHRSIVLLTDADTHPTLHQSTYEFADNGVDRVIQELQTMRHIMLFMMVPPTKTYEQIESSMELALRGDADRKIIARYVNSQGLANVKWDIYLQLLGNTVSATAIQASSMVMR